MNYPAVYLRKNNILTSVVSFFVNAVLVVEDDKKTNREVKIEKNDRAEYYTHSMKMSMDDIAKGIHKGALKNHPIKRAFEAQGNLW